MQSFSHLLLQLLTLINFQDNKHTFIQEFENQNYTETLLNLCDNLPPGKQEHVKNLLQKESADDIKDYLKDDISHEQFAAELNKVRSQALQGLVKSILPTLSAEQIRRMDHLLGNQIAY